MLGELDRDETGEFNTQLRLSEFGEKGFSKDGLSLVNCADSAPKLSRDDYIKQAKIIDTRLVMMILKSVLMIIWTLATIGNGKRPMI